MNFHSVKHANKVEDTQDFFNLFFNKYIKYANIPETSNFIFVMKKLNDYDVVLRDILILHKRYRVLFVIIEDQYSHNIMDKNKDDFLCQYFFHKFTCSNQSCVLVSNDKYSDKHRYLHLFTNDIVANCFQYSNKLKDVSVTPICYKMSPEINVRILKDSKSYIRRSIPKINLGSIL